jgi:hypothetical protein
MKTRLKKLRNTLVMFIGVFFLLSTTYVWAQEDESIARPSIKVRASKSYSPVQQQDFVQLFDSPQAFALPSFFIVTEGNAGNAYATLYVKHNNSIVAVYYMGGASSLHPNTPEDLTSGLKYVFHSCPAGLTPGDLIRTDYVKFEIAAGDYLSGPTRVALDLDVVESDIYVGLAKNAELSYPLTQQMQLSSLLKFKGDYNKLLWSYRNNTGLHELVYKKDDLQSSTYTLYSSSEQKSAGDIIDLDFFKMEFIKE